jgi:adenine phosphoribosyltransferase
MDDRSDMSQLEQWIRDVPDFPVEGIVFKDITPLLGNPAAMRETVDAMIAPFADADVKYVAGIESRGFIFGSLIADRLDAAFVPIRKPGKLPAAKLTESYELEYGKDAIEIHTDAIPRDGKVLMVDDLLATGGTMAAACRLVENLGGEIVGLTFVIELSFLNPREKLPGRRIHSLLQVSAE